MCRERLTHDDANFCVHGKTFGIDVVKAEDGDTKADSWYAMIRIIRFWWRSVMIRVVFRQLSIRHDSILQKENSNRFLGS